MSICKHKCEQVITNTQRITDIGEVIVDMREDRREDRKRIDKIYYWVIASALLSGANAVAFPEEVAKILAYITNLTL